MSLRIVRAIPFHEPARSFGGVVPQAALTSQGLAARGHRVLVLTTDLDVPADVPRDVPLARGGYDVVHAATSRPWHRVPPYACPLSRHALERAIADADVVLLNVGLTLWNRSVARAARAAGVPYVYNAEGCHCPRRLAVKRLRKAVFLRVVERDVIRGAAATIAVTAAEAEDLTRVGAAPARIRIIPNGVTPQRSTDPALRVAGRRMLGVDDAAPVVLHFGRLDPLKGIDLLLAAATQVARDVPGFHVRIVGPDYGARAALTARAARSDGRIRVLDALSGVDRERAYAAADVFALTSRSEGLPNAVLEAAARGLPCLVTEPCHVPEVALHDAGAVVPCDVDAIAVALRAFVVDPALRRRQGANARAMAESTFAIDRVVDRLEALLFEVAAESRRDPERPRR